MAKFGHIESIWAQYCAMGYGKADCTYSPSNSLKFMDFDFFHFLVFFCSEFKDFFEGFTFKKQWKVLKSEIVEEILWHVLRKIMFFVVVCSGSKDSLEGFKKMGCSKKHTFLEGFSRGFALDRRILSKIYHGVLKRRCLLWGASGLQN